MMKVMYKSNHQSFNLNALFYSLWTCLHSFMRFGENVPERSRYPWRTGKVARDRVFIYNLFPCLTATLWAHIGR